METRRVIFGTILQIAIVLFVVNLSAPGWGKTYTGPVKKAKIGNFAVHFLQTPGTGVKGSGFLAEGLAYGAFLAPTEVMLGVREKVATGKTRTSPRRLSMQFLEANEDVKMVGRGGRGAVAHFLTGNDPGQWNRNVPLHREIHYQDLWPGIDVRFYGNLNQLEFDFIIKPGADVDRVKLGFSGMDGLRINAKGQVMLRLADRELPVSLPRTYQEGKDGSRKTLACRFVQTGPGLVGFQVEDRNPNLALVIDPIFDFSTYLGGGVNWYADGYTEDYGMAVTFDNDGNVYVTGKMESSEFPVTRYFYPAALSGYKGMFVCKFDPDGNLLYSTRIHANRGMGIAVDPLGQIYLVGDTSSDDIPVVNGFLDYPGSSCMPARHAFLIKLNPDGSDILYSTFIGGDLGHDRAFDVAIDTDGCAYVAGSTRSPDFVSRNPIRPNMTRPVIDGVEYWVDDAFVVKIDTQLTGDDSLIFATTLGGTYYDLGYGIDIDADRNIYLVGVTKSADFLPLVGALQDHPGGCNSGFLTKINAACDRALYSTYLSGDGEATDVAVEDNGHAYVVGYTCESDVLPARNGFRDLPVRVEGFLARINTHLTGDASLIYATYIGGGGCDEARGVATNGHGRVYVTGVTNSGDFPGIRGDDRIGGLSDAFYSHIDTNLVGNASLLGSSYVGGLLDDKAYDVALGPRGEIALTGATVSSDFPTEAAYQEDHADGDGITHDAFAAKISDFEYWSLPVTDLPDGGGTFWYSGTLFVRLYAQASICRPMAIAAKSKNGMSLAVGLPEFEKEMDLFLTLRHKKYPSLFYYVSEKNTLARVGKTIYPWRRSANGSFKSYKTEILKLAELPKGDYDIALSVAPPGGSIKKAVYRWETETGVSAQKPDSKLDLNLVAEAAAAEQSTDETADVQTNGGTNTGGCFISSLF